MDESEFKASGLACWVIRRCGWGGGWGWFRMYVLMACEGAECKGGKKGSNGCA